MSGGRGIKALTAEDIADIRDMNAKGYPLRYLAQLYGVDRSTIQRGMRYYPVQSRELAIMPRRPHPLTWAQRVIWAQV